MYMYKICFITLLITNMFQVYKEYNNLPHGISGTTHYYNKCLKHRVFQPTHFPYYSFSATPMVLTKVIDTCW